MVTRTPLGYEIRAAGSNLRALEVQGTDAQGLILVVMLISGALAGLAGATEVYGVHYRLKLVPSPATAIPASSSAILGQLTPRGIVIGAVLFGGLVNGPRSCRSRQACLPR